MPFAAMALAPVNAPYDCTRYCDVPTYPHTISTTATQNDDDSTLTKMHRFPHANGTAATRQLAQCTPPRADHANQKMPTGTPTLPIIET